MANIDIKTEGNLLIASVTGELTSDEVIAVVEKYYANGIVLHVIWDLTNGSLSTITNSGYRDIARATFAALKGGARRNGKTVFVGDNSADFGLMRMYAVIAELAGVPIEYQVFRTVDDALKWLPQDPDFV